MKKLFLTLFAGIFIFGCGQGQHDRSEEQHGEKHHEMKSDASQITGQVTGGVVLRDARKDEAGINAVCPVMGTKFTVREGGLAADYKGRAYYFYCGGCPDAFEKNPEKYIQ
ncbi:MAG: YHS domain-containing protein [bacterium]